jgi:hypothetical protein
MVSARRPQPSSLKEFIILELLSEYKINFCIRNLFCLLTLKHLLYTSQVMAFRGIDNLVAGRKLKTPEIIVSWMLFSNRRFLAISF